MEFLGSFLRCHFTGKPMLVSRNVSCFFRLVVWECLSHSSFFLFAGERSIQEWYVLSRKMVLCYLEGKLQIEGWSNLSTDPVPLQYIYRTRDKIRDFYEVWIKCPFFTLLKQGCALRKIEGSPVLCTCKFWGAQCMICVKKKPQDCPVTQEQKLGAKGCQALLDFSPVKRSCDW